MYRGALLGRGADTYPEELLELGAVVECRDGHREAQQVLCALAPFLNHRGFKPTCRPQDRRAAVSRGLLVPHFLVLPLSTEQPVGVPILPLVFPGSSSRCVMTPASCWLQVPERKSWAWWSTHQLAHIWEAKVGGSLEIEPGLDYIRDVVLRKSKKQKPNQTNSKCKATCSIV